MNEWRALRNRCNESFWPCLTRRTWLESPSLNSAAANEGTPRPGAFATTRWSLILSGADSKGAGKETRAALAELCRIYWRPIFAFISRRVLKSLQNFLNDAADKTYARKRGGDVSFVSWDAWMAEAPSQLSISTETLNSWPAERLFDVRWAATVVERALRRLREECERKGRLRVFDVLSAYLTAERDDVSSVNLATTLGVPQATVKKLLYHMRQRYRWLLRDEVAHTVENPADIEDELRYLCSALAASLE